MNELIEGLVTKAGISQETAEKIVEFLKENAHRLPDWLGAELPDLSSLKGKFGF